MLYYVIIFTISCLFSHLKFKSAKSCLLVMFPGLNIFFAIYFAAKGSKTASVPNSTSTTSTQTITTTTTTTINTTPTPPRVSPKIEANLTKAKQSDGNSAISQPFTPMQPSALRPVITPPNTGISMANVLSGNFELFLDESEMTQGSVTGFVKNTNYWFKCTATQSVDLKSFSVVFDFAKSLNPSKSSMVVQSDRVVMLPQIYFNSITNGLSSKKYGSKLAEITPLITGMVAQRVLF